MNNYERIQARIARDKIRRQQKRRESNKEFDNFHNVIKMQNYYAALRKCKRGVSWKGTVQAYCQNAITEIDCVVKSIETGELPKLHNINKIELYERGKRRIITPINIKDRMTQRVLCDYSLAPVLQRNLIYDNGASMAGKGVEFTRQRLNRHLKEVIKEYGSEFYALTFDFKSYFDNIPHKTCYNVLKDNFQDKYIIGLTMAIIKSYQEPFIQKEENEAYREEMLYKLKHNQLRGICLGSQISQVMALAVPNKLDHFIKDVNGVRHYIRYMDDGIILSDNKDFLRRLYTEMKVVAESLGLKFNEKKTKIVKMSKGFVFMKVKYFITKSGKIVRTLTRPGIVRMRKKLKKFRKLVDCGKIMYDDVYNSMQSWLSHSKIAHSYTTKKNMLKLYNELFDGYKLTKKYEHVKGGKINEVLQTDKWRDFRWDSDNNAVTQVSA